MAHVAKFNRGTLGHMLSHYDRSKKNISGNIDWDLTPNNYNLAAEQQPLKQLDFIHSRCDEVRMQNRKDINVMCCWVVTAPKDLPEAENKAFFQASFDFLQNRYGKENTISAYVHMDETTPHMHFSFMPVVADRRRGGFKVSAKEVVTRSDLQTFHTDLQKHVENVLGHEVGVLNEATKDGNKSIEELKRGTAIEKLRKTLSEVETAQKDVLALKEDKNALEGQIRSLEGKILTLQEVNQIKIKKPLLGSEKAVVSMPYQDALNLQRTAGRIGEVDGMLRTVNQKTKELQKAQIALDKERDEVRRIPMKEQMERVQLRKENESLKKQIDTVNRIVEKRPDLFAELQKEAKTLTSPKKSKGFELER